MKGFALDKEGDVLIENNEIQMVNGVDLTTQTVKTILSTQKGEWAFNQDEGINLKNILGKQSGDPKTAANDVYVDKINNLTQQIQQLKDAYGTDKYKELNERLESRLDGET